MAIYNNFLNTSYIVNSNIIQIGELGNELGSSGTNMDNAFVVYCSPEYISYSNLLDYFYPSTIPFTVESQFRNDLSFKNKTITNDVTNLTQKVNLNYIYNALETSLNNSVNVYNTYTVKQIDVLKFFTPYYTNNIILKTKYCNMLSLNDFIIQMNNIYTTSEPITINNILNLKQLLPSDFYDFNYPLKIELNYILYCPYYDYPIRFIYQYMLIFD
jgi:hypothetical protein